MEVLTEGGRIWILIGGIGLDFLVFFFAPVAKPGEISRVMLWCFRLGIIVSNSSCKCFEDPDWPLGISKDIDWQSDRCGRVSLTSDIDCCELVSSKLLPIPTWHMLEVFVEGLLLFVSLSIRLLSSDWNWSIASKRMFEFSATFVVTEAPLWLAIFLRPSSSVSSRGIAHKMLFFERDIDFDCSPPFLIYMIEIHALKI